MKQTLCLAFLLALLLPGIAATQATAQTANPQTAFFENLRKLCGQRFAGATEFPQNADHPMVGKKLWLAIESCQPKEIRILFQVEEDKSRTWILRLDDQGLLLKHDHRHADGTQDAVSMYGGWASKDGSATRQRFPADEATAKLLPEAATNVWMIEIDADKRQLVYYLERHQQPRYRAVFRLQPLQQ